MLLALLLLAGGVAGAEAWPHVVLADGRLYCKDRAGRLQCFEVPDRKASESLAA